jgi:allophanate hydrolase
VNIESLTHAYRSGSTTPTKVIQQAYQFIRSLGARPIWIYLVSEEENLTRATFLEGSANRDTLPLYGIPFAVKDNFDVAGMPTTAACPAFSHVADETAEAVQRLIDAGAILIGKTNMDQFATGLVGTRSPYGICSSVFDADYISGGSSSGSAVAVAHGLVSFSLGTDTAGSGRVPAACNQLVGLKPTRGLVSTHGVLPACRTLDCVSVFTETCADASKVLAVLRGKDAKDPYSREASPGMNAAPWLASSFRFGVPTKQTLEFFGDGQSEDCFEYAIRALVSLGGELVAFDYTPFRDVASLLYNGPWVAERLAAVQPFANDNLDSLDPTVAEILAGASRFSAKDAFIAQYTLQELRSQVKAVMDQVDFLLLPTIPTTYKIEEIRNSPIQLNSNLGYYTNFVNLLDLSAVAIPAGMKDNGLPFGVSLAGSAFSDEALLAIGDRLHRSLATLLGGSGRLLKETGALPRNATPPGCVLVAVVGAHLTGQPLNWQLTTRKARLVSCVRSHGDYRLFLLPNSVPAKPGLVFEPGYGGKGIELEVWAVPEDTVGTFLTAIPPPLSLGTVLLEDTTQVKGFLCEPAGIVGAKEITDLGGWRAYIQQAGESL